MGLAPTREYASWDRNALAMPMGFACSKYAVGCSAATRLAVAAFGDGSTVYHGGLVWVTQVPSGAKLTQCRVFLSWAPRAGV